MKTALECLPCFLRQSVIALDFGTDDEALKRRAMRRLMPIVERTDYDRPPAWTTSFLHRVIREELGRDPFAGVKKRYNEIALELYADLKERVRRAEDPLWMATRLAIAGNIIDFGLSTEIELDRTIARATEGTLAVDQDAEFRTLLDRAGDVLYLLDNAGEIVFDRLLIEELAARGKRVTAVVRGEAVLNDATLDDAEQAGLPGVCRVIRNGSDGIGTILEWCSDELVEAYRKAGLVISKGQANYETLAGETRPTVFLLQAKCGVLARAVGVPLGGMMLRTVSP